MNDLSESIVAFENITAGGAEIRAAIERGCQVESTQFSVSHPPPEYVRYEGTVYQLVPGAASGTTTTIPTTTTAATTTSTTTARVTTTVTSTTTTTTTTGPGFGSTVTLVGAIAGVLLVFRRR